MNAVCKYLFGTDAEWTPEDTRGFMAGLVVVGIAVVAMAMTMAIATPIK